MGNIFDLDIPIVFVIIIVLSVVAFWLYEVGKERGKTVQDKDLSLIDLEAYEAMLISTRESRKSSGVNLPYPQPIQRPYNPNDITAAQKKRLDDNLAVAMEIWRRYEEQDKTQ